VEIFILISINIGMLRKKSLKHMSLKWRGPGEEWISFFKNETENAGQRISVKKAEVFEVIKWLDH